MGERFSYMEFPDSPRSPEACGCFTTAYQYLGSEQALGMDASFAEASLLFCSVCGQPWLRYFYEVEAFTASGRWYLGAISKEQAGQLTAENAKAVLENLNWYFYGGSYFGGRTGRNSGRIYLST
jgi:hypothetical protein